MGVTITSRGVTPRPVTYVFVDAGHLRPNFAGIIEAWLGHPTELYVAGVRDLFSANKVFYYDSIDDVSRNGESTEQLDSRIREQEATLRQVNAVPNTHVRFGSITGRGRKRRQKEVDILIAVDMMNHAVRQNMDRAVLVAGDRDFAPLVETLVQFGLTVEVAGDFRYTSDVLQGAADAYRPLGLQNYAQMLEPHERQKMPPMPSFHGGDAPVRPRDQALASGTCAEYECRLFPRVSTGFIFEMKTKWNARYAIVEGVDDLKRLALYLQLEHAAVPWLEQYCQSLIM